MFACHFIFHIYIYITSFSLSLCLSLSLSLSLYIYIYIYIIIFIVPSKGRRFYPSFFKLQKTQSPDSWFSEPMNFIKDLKSLFVFSMSLNIYEFCLKNNGTGCDIWAMDEKWISELYYVWSKMLSWEFIIVISFLKPLYFFTCFCLHFFCFRLFSYGQWGMNEFESFSPVMENSVTNTWNASAIIWR